MGYSGAGGKLIHEKNQKQKISWHCPFNSQYNSIQEWSRIVNYMALWSPCYMCSVISELEFLKSLWGLGTEEE